MLILSVVCEWNVPLTVLFRVTVRAGVRVVVASVRKYGPDFELFFGDFV